MKHRILAGLGAGLIALTAILAVPADADAAKGGARISAPRPRPAAAPRPAPVQPGDNKAARPNQEYKPSKPASQAAPTAPKATPAPAAAPAANAGTPWGGMMRNIGLLAGGMMLGSLLGQLFGFGGSGFLADLLGLLMNGLLIYAGIRLVLWLIARFRGRSAAKNPYAAVQRAPEPEPERAFEGPLADIAPPSGSGRHGVDYDPRRTADWYRRQ